MIRRAEADDARTDVQHLRHDVLSVLTVIQGQTQLLQRQLQRMDGVSDRDRQRLDARLGMILEAARALGPTLDQLATSSPWRDERYPVATRTPAESEQGRRGSPK